MTDAPNEPLARTTSHLRWEELKREFVRRRHHALGARPVLTAPSVDEVAQRAVAAESAQIATSKPTASIARADPAV